MNLKSVKGGSAMLEILRETLRITFLGCMRCCELILIDTEATLVLIFMTQSFVLSIKQLSATELCIMLFFLLSSLYLIKSLFLILTPAEEIKVLTGRLKNWPFSSERLAKTTGANVI